MKAVAAAVAAAVQTLASIVGNRGILLGSVLMHLDKEGERVIVYNFSFNLNIVL